ncbi:MAG TPA: NADPH-dependent FMN reductase, partial [Byssovorax sp.]
MRVATLAGSHRAGSLNRRLAALASRLATKHGAAAVDVIDLKPLDLPLYDGDVEAQGLPPGVVELRARLAASPALFVACPEYNASIPGPLKNAIDWASRPPAQPFMGKVAAIACVTGGTSGGARVLPDLR